MFIGYCYPYPPRAKATMMNRSFAAGFSLRMEEHSLFPDFPDEILNPLSRSGRGVGVREVQASNSKKAIEFEEFWFLVLGSCLGYSSSSMMVAVLMPASSRAR